jgi:hypothetical protein
MDGYCMPLVKCRFLQFIAPAFRHFWRVNPERRFTGAGLHMVVPKLLAAYRRMVGNMANRLAPDGFRQL